MFLKDKSVLGQLEKALAFEWLETNGLGGYSSSSIIGCNTRRYHGLLVAALNSPAERFSLLAKMDETAILKGQRYELGVNQYAGNVFSPNGNQLLLEFEKDVFVGWTYRFGGAELRKKLAMIHGENTVVIIYDLIQSDEPLQIEFLPLISARGYHQLQSAQTSFMWNVDFRGDIFCNQPHALSPPIYISIPGSTYSHHPQWYYHFDYLQEKERGLDHVEDLFNHGTLKTELKPGDSLGVIISTQDPDNRNAHALLAAESLRRQTLLVGCPEDATAKQLTLAADQFVVRRGADMKSIIAGYHWFTDWTRDAMIAMPGLCLSTRRLEDARRMLKEFASMESMGMLPNRFRDDGGLEYNNVDGTLWFFVAIYKYLQSGGEKDFVLEDMLPVMRDILEWHQWGTRYHIHMDEDGLLYAGEPGTQLTWMDAKVGAWVVTPRIGKPVEVNALWYNAQKIYAALLALNGEIEEAAAAEVSAKRTRDAFEDVFWNEIEGYCYDVVDGQNKDASIRPNAIFSFSLPFALFEGDKAMRIFQKVKDRLYTPMGLRSLDPADSRYKSVYHGNLLQRDSAYHQGTVWTWLLGPYIDAMMKVKAGDAYDEARSVVDAFKYHLSNNGIGTVSEIANADYPFNANGCIAQAWGVGEWLRVICDYKLYEEAAG